MHTTGGVDAELNVTNGIPGATEQEEITTSTQVSRVQRLRSRGTPQALAGPTDVRVPAKCEQTSSIRIPFR